MTTTTLTQFATRATKVSSTTTTRTAPSVWDVLRDALAAARASRVASPQARVEIAADFAARVGR